MPAIQVDDQLITSIAQNLSKIRSETAPVRNGSNPADPGHPTGFPLSNIVVAPGGPNWPTGADVKAKLTASGQQVDQRFVQVDQKIAHYVQVLLNLLRDSDDTEQQNIFTANFMSQ